MTATEREMEIRWMRRYAELLRKTWLDPKYDPAGHNEAEWNVIENHLDEIENGVKQNGIGNV